MNDKSFFNKLVDSADMSQEERTVIWEAKCRPNEWKAGGYPSELNPDGDVPDKLIIYQIKDDPEGFYLIPIDKDGNDFPAGDSRHNRPDYAKKWANNHYNVKISDWKLC